jgi:signal transduction histidine kinase
MSRQKILIVDDLEPNLFALEDALEPVGVRIDKALSGLDALKAIEKNDYSVVLMDVQMPGMDGFETAENIMKLNLKRIPPIIFVTAISKEEHYVLKGYRSGCIDYLLKPLNLDLVRNKVRFCMDLHMRVLENEDLIDELQQFAYVASHDLQEPIRMVRNYVQLLAKRYQGQLDEKAQKYISYVLEGSERMQLLIHDLLRLSRVSSQGEILQATDANQVLSSVLKSLQLLIEEIKAKIEHDPLPVVSADSTQLGQVFQNLISNAIKFHGDKAPEIKVGVRELAHAYEFFVSDNGIGINKAYFDQIFVIFQRLHTRDKYEGSGIGLALCKKIIDRHGGRIWVESNEGEGSKFFFTLKKSQGQAAV